MNLKNYVCRLPFTYMEANPTHTFACCPTWLPTPIGLIEDIENVRESDALKKIQDSMLDGSYSYCDSNQCPILNDFVNNNIIDKKNFIPIKEFKKEDYNFPQTINFGYDNSCNLSCPSCRTEVIMANGEQQKKINNITQKIIDTFGSNLEVIHMSTIAEPLASKAFKKILTTIDKKKYPKLRYVNLHTNGILFTKEMWSKLKPIHKLLKSIEISIDAASKETYEVVRRGGNWDILIENLKFIASLNINYAVVSMVVQDNNYMEMADFYELMQTIFNGKVKVFFKKVNNWGAYTSEEYNQKQIWNETHPEFNLFLLQLSKIAKKHNCFHNMNDIVLAHIPKEIKFI
jgi:MoaA/NifB/PqqE/SkfB family radical SAM enzyme